MSDVTNKEITQEMVDEFNAILIEENSVIRLEKCDRVFGTINIVFQEDEYIDNFILKPTRKFYQKLENFFLGQHGIYLSYNNTASCFWLTTEKVLQQ